MPLHALELDSGFDCHSKPSSPRQLLPFEAQPDNRSAAEHPPQVQGFNTLSHSKRHTWYYVLQTKHILECLFSSRSRKRIRVCLLLSCTCYTHNRMEHFKVYTLKPELSQYWEHFLFPSLLSTLEACFPIAKLNHTPKAQYKLFYYSIVPATKDALRTCLSAGFCRGSLCHWNSPQIPRGQKCHMQMLVYNLHLLTFPPSY